MGLFNRLFRRTSGKSLIRQYAKDREENKPHSTSTIERLGDVLLWTIAVFGEGAGSPKETSKSNEISLFRNIQALYAGDLPLFEISAYTLFRLDLWLFAKHPDHRDLLFDVFSNRIIDAFTDAIGVDVSDSLNSRLNGYGMLTRKGAEMSEFHRHLSQILCRCRDSTSLVKYEFNDTLLIMDAFERYWLQSNITAFDVTMIPGFMKSIEKCIEDSQSGGGIGKTS